MSHTEWDQLAATFDDEPDHGLRDPHTRAAWRTLLLSNLPAAPARVADLGSGTGTLAALLTEDGYQVDGVDYSPEMVRAARIKVPQAHFVVADAAEPPLSEHSFEVVLCRHVLWALPDPQAALARWVDLLRPGGRLVLIEGDWATGAGLTAAETTTLVQNVREHAVVTPLPDAVYWGRAITDERYLVVSLR